MSITGGKRVKNKFYKYVSEKMDEYTNELVIRLIRIGEQCVNEARNAGKYQDQTGNLRSSIGFAVVNDGRIVRISDFPKVKTTATEAKHSGMMLVNELARLYNEGITLIVVAGMDYAVYVEARNYNVLDSAETLAKTLVADMLKRMGL